jgi:osmotically inducible lipoprotein OsmB
MKNRQSALKTTLIVAMFISLTGCAGMSRQGQGTLLGAGAGALGGAALTGGSAVGTIGGAAVGGLLGNVITQPRARGRYRR